MNQPEDERQKLIKKLNASLELPSPEWIPRVGDQAQAFYFGEWLPATVLSCPNNHPDPIQRISGWKIHLLTLRRESYIWKLEHFKPTGEDLDQEPF